MADYSDDDDDDVDDYSDVDPHSNLPEGWIAVPDPSSGNIYYANATTGQSSWEKPNPDGTIPDPVDDDDDDEDEPSGSGSQVEGDDFSNDDQQSSSQEQPYASSQQQKNEEDQPDQYGDQQRARQYDGDDGDDEEQDKLNRNAGDREDDDDDDDDNEDTKGSSLRNIVFIVLCILIVVVVITVPIVVQQNKKSDEAAAAPAPAPVDGGGGGAATPAPTPRPECCAAFETNLQLQTAVTLYLKAAASTNAEDGRLADFVKAKYGDSIGDWDVSAVTRFDSLFDAEKRNPEAASFNEDLSAWVSDGHMRIVVVADIYFITRRKNEIRLQPHGKIARYAQYLTMLFACTNLTTATTTEY
jgi:flagellar basal body-associated protein FliL